MPEKQNMEFLAQYANALSGKPKTAALIDEYVTDPELKAHILTFEAAFPSYELSVEDVIADGDKVVIRATFHGLHSGEFMGIPASGAAVSAQGIIIYRIENGRIVEHWMQFDIPSLMEQLRGASARA